MRGPRPALSPYGASGWAGAELRDGGSVASVAQGDRGCPAVRAEPAAATADGAVHGITLQVTSTWSWLLSQSGTRAHQLVRRHMGLELALDGLVIKL